MAKKSARVRLGCPPDDLAPVLSRVRSSNSALVGENKFCDELHCLHPFGCEHVKGNSTTAQNRRDIIRDTNPALAAPSFSPYHRRFTASRVLPSRSIPARGTAESGCGYFFARRPSATPIRRYNPKGRAGSEQKLQLCPEIGRAAAVINGSRSNVVERSLNSPTSDDLKIDRLLYRVIDTRSDPFLIIF
jgi:hypothetical protein